MKPHHVPPENFFPVPSNEREAQISDDKTATGRIDVHATYELGYWSRKFGVTREELLEAVQKVGTHAEDVAIELGKSYP